MSRNMTYKGYEAVIDYSAEDRLLHGRVIGIRDVISFHGESVPELADNFQGAVDDYLAMCEEEGQEPNRPFSGKMSLRMDPATHRAAALAANRAGVSLNQWINQVVQANTRRAEDRRESAV